MRRHPVRRRGTSLVWTALVLFALLGMVGLSLDLGQGMLVAHELQNAADAAALAGALRVKADQAEARQAAIDVAAVNEAVRTTVALAANDGNVVGGDIVLGRFERSTQTFRDTLELPNAVKVQARVGTGSLNAPMPLFFGRMAGVETVDVGRTAVAMVQGGSGAGLIALCPDCPCALRFNGDNDLIISTTEEYDGEGAVQVNSSDECAVCGSGTALTIEADEINIVGDDCWNGQPTINADVNPGSPSMGDPLADLPAPTWDPAADLGSITSSGTYGPGYYSGGIRLTAANDSVVLLPGVYVVDGPPAPAGGLYVNGGDLTAHEVMFHVIGDGQVYLGGNGIIDITPSTAENDPYQNISIFQARDNTNPATIIGTSNMNLEGTYYFPVAHLGIGGTGIALGNQVIAWTVHIYGTGEYYINYDGQNPTTGYKVFLVE